MDRLWDWYKKSRSSEALSVFVDELRKTNAQKGILLKHQQLDVGDISGSLAVFMADIVEQHGINTQVISAVLEMNKFCNIHCAHTKNAGLNTEKLMIPAFLEVMMPEINKRTDLSVSAKKSKIVVAKYKTDLLKDSDPLMRNVYDNYISSFKQTLKQAQNIRKPQQRTNQQKIYRI